MEKNPAADDELAVAMEFWNAVLKNENKSFFPYKYKHRNRPCFHNLRNKPALQVAHANFDNILTEKKEQLGCSRDDAIALIEATLPKPKSYYKPIFPIESFEFFPPKPYRDFEVTEEMIRNRQERCLETFYDFFDNAAANAERIYKSEMEKKARKLLLQRCYTFIKCMLLFLSFLLLCLYFKYY